MVSLKLLDQDPSLLCSLNDYLGFDLMQNKEILQKITQARHLLEKDGIHAMGSGSGVTKIVKMCEQIGREAVSFEKKEYADKTVKSIKF
jgi:ferrous iron transport protein B